MADRYLGATNAHLATLNDQMKLLVLLSCGPCLFLIVIIALVEFPVCVNVCSLWWVCDIIILLLLLVLVLLLSLSLLLLLLLLVSLVLVVVISIQH